MPGSIYKASAKLAISFLLAEPSVEGNVDITSCGA
jgi:hypothetical protein